MEPVIARSSATTKSLNKGVPADLMACVISGFLSLGALGYSTYFFLRFLENDAHWQGIISAFTLCYGLGSLAFIPAAILAYLAWKTYKSGAAKRRLIWAGILLFPWLVFGLVLIFYSGLPVFYAVTLFISILVLLLWTITRLVQARSRA